MRKILVLITSFITSSLVLFGQGNFTCETAQLIVPQNECNPLVVPMVGITQSVLTEAGNDLTLNGMYYTFVATSTAVAIDAFTTEETETDVVIGTLYGNCADQMVLSHRVDLVADGREPIVMGDLVIGQTYYFVVSLYDFSEPLDTDVFELCLTALPEIVNDECVSAISLTPISFTDEIEASDLTYGTIFGSTLSTNVELSACAGQVDNIDVWYSFVAEASESTIFLSGIDYNDLAFNVYSGVCGELEYMTCVNRGRPGLDVFDESITLDELVVGQTYYIRVQESDLIYFGQAGRFGIVVINPEGLSVSKLEQSTVAVYPNPAKEVITIDAKTEITSIDVMNTLGQVVASQSGSNAMSVKLDTTSFDNGLYVITIYANGEKITKKINVVK